MIKVFNLNRQLTAILENAHGVSYDKQSKAVWTASFKMPANDPKNEKIKLLGYVEITDDLTGEYIGLFRVLPKKHTFSNSTDEIVYECEHVLSTLLGSVLFQYHQTTNYTTTQVLQYLLSRQVVAHWKIGTVAFTRYFDYSWENENLLSALFSIPEPFDAAYEWTFDTTSYPWTLNLVEAETVASTRIIQGYNLTGFAIEENPNSLWNRIYPLGAGEGVNQLNIKAVNGGVPYIEDAASIAQYGLYETVWADKRYESAETLIAAGRSLLTQWKEPIVTWEASALDVSSATGIEADKLRMGKVCRVQLDGYGNVDLRILKETKSDLTGSPEAISLELGNLSADLGTTATDIAKKQLVNQLYSQGATNILNFGYQDNCDSSIPALIPFYLDEDVVNVNTCELTFRTKKFRAYSGVTAGGGGTVQSTTSGGSTTQSTTSGGSTTQTSTSGGGSTQTSSSAGESTQTSSANGSHSHAMFQTTGSSPLGSMGVNATCGGGLVITLGGAPSMQEIRTLEGVDNHSHSVTTPAHTHRVTVPAHSHSTTIPAHDHSVTIPNHSHDVTIPEHTHDIVHQIVEDDATASSVIIKVDGVTVPHTATSGDRIDLAPYLSSDGSISRGRHEITITPNDNARIEADLILRVFIRSHIGGNL
jgi:phage minor structural protein